MDFEFSDQQERKEVLDSKPELDDLSAPKLEDIFKQNLEEKESLAEKVKEEVQEMEHQKILREHGGLESNIPINHPYWRIRP